MLTTTMEAVHLDFPTSCRNALHVDVTLFLTQNFYEINETQSRASETAN